MMNRARGVERRLTVFLMVPPFCFFLAMRAKELVAKYQR